MLSENTENRFLLVTFILVIALGFQIRGQYIGALNWVVVDPNETNAVTMSSSQAKNSRTPASESELGISAPSLSQASQGEQGNQAQAEAVQFSEVNINIPCGLKSETMTITGHFVRLKGTVSATVDPQIAVFYNQQRMDFFYLPEVKKFVTDVLYLYEGTNSVTFKNKSGTEICRLDMVRN